VNSFTHHRRARLMIATAGMLIATIGISGWILSMPSNASPVSTSSDVGPFPAAVFKNLPPEKQALLTAPPTAYSGPPLSNSISACGGAATCRPEGIFPAGQAPWSFATDFASQNEYIGTHLGQNLEVYAGEAFVTGSGSSQTVLGGGLRVVSGDGLWKQYLAPVTPGWLKITSVNGDTISLVSQSGAIVDFSLTSLSFLQ